MNPYDQYQQYLYREKMYAKHLRRTFSVVGWTLVIYYVLMNAAVAVVMMVDVFTKILPMMIENPNYALDENALMETVANNGWGYIMAVVIGLFVLLVWKGKDYWRNEIFAKGKPMTVGTFFAVMSITLGVQLISTLFSYVLEMLLNQFGLSMMGILEDASGQSNSLSMFIYASVCAPVTEEILFRGFVQRTLQPYGKKFAIFGSAVLFGLFHGNLIQTPYAFLVGLVLGYVAAEYSIGWAMLLHMINNLLIADSLNRLTAGLPEEAAAIVIWAVLLFFGVGAVVVLISKRKDIRVWRQQETINRTYLGCFFSSAGMIVFVALMAIMMVVSLYLMITPI